MSNIKPIENQLQQKPYLREQNGRLIKSKFSSPVSFKGSVPTLITEADRRILNVFSEHYGDIGERLGRKVGKLVTSSNILSKSARFSMEKGALSITEKKIGQSIAENIVFPFATLPLYGASWVLKKAQSVPALSVGAKKLYNKAILRIPRKLNELDSKTDMLKGMFDKTQEVVSKYAKEKGLTSDYVLDALNKVDKSDKAQKVAKDASEFVKENLYKVSNKFFDKHTGNFNTAYERPLNRIVSGLIPVAFLANDAYNLSVLCGDKKEDSIKEAKQRKRQEISRVFTTAYIQLLTFGAFTKQVNTISWFTPLTSAATVLFSEITSRKLNGKPIFFITKEQAIERNKKGSKEDKKSQKISGGKIFGQKQPKNKENASNIKQPVEVQTKRTYTIVPEESEPSVFTSFKSLDTPTETSVAKSKTSATDKKEKTQKNKEQKALINFSTFKKAVIILTGVGFALSFLKNSSLTKDSSLVKGVKNIGKFFKEKIYNKLAFKDFEMSESKFSSMMGNLKDVGCEKVAEGHEFICQKYAKRGADGIIRMYKSSVSASKVPEIVSSIIDKAKEKGINLSDAEFEQVGAAVKTAIGLEKTSIAENKFGQVAQKTLEIINNKKLQLGENGAQSISEIISEVIGSHAKSSPLQVKTKIKPFVDILTEPFKFIFSAFRLPFKITSGFVKILADPIEKKAAEAALGKKELSKFEKIIHKTVTEIFGEKSSKAGKISQEVFANAMEQLERHTAPYKKLEIALQNAKANNLGAVEIKRLEDALAKAKEKLMIYVNTAVEKSFNGVTQSSNKNTDLAIMSKMASSLVTSAFLVADNYNMVMLKSNGEDKEGAKEKANERIIQRLSGLFYQAMLINWFNATFRTTYNSSLKGMAAVVIPNTLTTEILTRKSIGMPIGRKTLDELNEIDEKNENHKGFLGKYFKFMRLLTGKKPLKDRLPKDKQKVNTDKTTENKKVTTNLLERYSK